MAISPFRRGKLIPPFMVMDMLRAASAGFLLSFLACFELGARVTMAAPGDKKLTTPSEMCAKIAAAVLARHHLYVIAGTDAVAAARPRAIRVW